jgi:hypothetical protein
MARWFGSLLEIVVEESSVLRKGYGASILCIEEKGNP